MGGKLGSQTYQFNVLFYPYHYHFIQTLAQFFMENFFFSFQSFT